MCNVGAIGLGISAAGIVSNYVSEQNTSASYSKYQALTTQATLTNYIQQTKAINNRYAEEQEATSAQKQQIYIQNLQAQATAEASAAGSGVTGSTIDTLFKGYDRATAVSNYTAARNLQLKGLQYSDELAGLKAQAISAINLEQPYIANSSSTLIGGLGGLLTGFSNMQLRQEQLDFYKRGSKV